jgi:hypothetical protein
MFDRLHQVLFPINRWINKDPLLSVILIGQLFIDGFVVLITICWYFLPHSGWHGAKISGFPISSRCSMP